jgi:monofunctional biosynthetic peptidoglycan transglycosylase
MPSPGARSKGFTSLPARKKKAGYLVQTVGGAAALVFGCCAYVYLTLPDVRPLAKTNPSTTAFMTLRAEEARAKGQEPLRIQRWVPYSQISPELRRAVLIAEDDAFFQHEGVDFVQLRQSFQMDLARGTFVRGASTITQQLAKNLYLSPSKNPLRKVREFIIARRLEAELKKERILELYLNEIEWGDGVYGIEAASQMYYHRPSASLSAAEAALLAGAIVNPRKLNPAHPSKRLLNRQKIILKRMQTGPPAGTRKHAAPPIEPKPEEEKLEDLKPDEPMPDEPEPEPEPPQ